MGPAGKKLTSADNLPYNFGSAVAINGDTAVIGGFAFDYPTPPTQPVSSYIYELDTATATVTVAPVVESVAIGSQQEDANPAALNDGPSQRSMVDSIFVTFGLPVTIDPDAISLTQDGVPVGFVYKVISYPGRGDGQTVLQLFFSGPGIIGDSLPDGHYTVFIDGNRVHWTGQTFSAEASRTFSFSRLFGDTNGDGVVDNLDYYQFRQAYGKTAGQDGYLWYLDIDGDGDVDNLDYFWFRGNYGKKM